MSLADADDVREIVGRVRQGDRDAYGRIVTLFERRLMSLATMILRDPSAAEEIVQDTFVRAYVHLDKFDDRRAFYPWLAKIAVRLSQNRIARRQRFRIDDGADPKGRAIDVSGADPEQALIVDEASGFLWRAVAALPRGERTAIVLCYRQDMSIADAARALGVTSGTVKTWLFRARCKLRADLASAREIDPPKEKT